MSETKKTRTEDLFSPKGMRDIAGNDYYRFQGFFEKAQEIANFYGFEPIETPVLEKTEVFATGVGEGTDIVEKEMYELKTKGGDSLVLRPEGTAAIMRSYIEQGMMNRPQPVYLYTYGPYFRHDKPQKGRYRQFYQFSVEILGKTKSTLDALVIYLGYKILEEAGIKDVSIKLNSIGDKESRTEYLRALTGYYRKFVNQLPPVDRERLKKNPLRILDSKEEKTKELNVNAPQALNYLNPVSKKHFKEVIEHLDELGVPYTIDHTMVRGLDYYTHTVFEYFATVSSEFGDGTESLALGGGGRYDYLAKRLGSKKDIPAVGMALGVDRILELSTTDLAPRIMKKPKVCFIQLGIEAKTKSLAIIEALRKAKMPLFHALGKDNISSQLAQAEKMGIPVAIIFGQKEAIDGTVMVRNMENRQQKTVPIEELAEYLKKMKI